MSPEERQAALDNISVEDLAKIQAKTSKIKVYPEDLLLAEFALRYGWDAYKEARDDKIKSKEMMKLIVASRKLDDLQQLKNAQSAFIGAASANAKSPSTTFSKMTRKLVKRAEADS